MASYIHQSSIAELTLKQQGYFLVVFYSQNNFRSYCKCVHIEMFWTSFKKSDIE